MINIAHIDSDTDIEEVRLLFQEYETYLGIDLCFQNFEEALSSYALSIFAPSFLRVFFYLSPFQWRG